VELSPVRQYDHSGLSPVPAATPSSFTGPAGGLLTPVPAVTTQWSSHQSRVRPHAVELSPVSEVRTVELSPVPAEPRPVELSPVPA